MTDSNSEYRSICKSRHGMNTLVLGAFIAVLAQSGNTVAQEAMAGRIEAVTLSSSGLAEIRRSIRVDGPTGAAFDVPLEQVNDILKSLLVHDPAGGVSSMTLDGLSPVEETFRGLPFTPDDMGALPQLLAKLQGISVHINSAGRTIEGVVLGVDARTPAADDAARPDPLVSLLTPEGLIEVVPLGEDAVLDILDPSVLENLRTAASVSGRSRVEDMHTISIALEGAGERTVDVTYVVAAPIWKTAYRVIVDTNGTARLQAWAVIENASGQDWEDVDLTLSSGVPVTLTQRLHERYWPDRPEIPVLAQTINPVRPDIFGQTRVGRAGIATLADSAADAELVAAESAPAPAAAPAPPSVAVAVAEGVEADTAATYRLPIPIDLSAGRTLSVPFIDAELPADRVSLFQPERGEVHPVAALRLENITGTSLPAGIATVYAPQEEGYAGDTQLAILPAGESRMLSFAADRKVDVTTENGEPRTAYRATLADGVLRVSGVTRVETAYTISGAPDAPRTVIIEQPRRNGWDFASDALAGSTPTHYRLEAELAAGETAEIVASFERTEFNSIALVEMDSARLFYWADQIDDPDVSAELADLADRQQAITRIRSDISDIEDEIDVAVNEQKRIRDNLATLGTSNDLAQRYLAMLEEQEDRIGRLNAQRQAARQDLAAAEGALSRAISAL